MSRDNAKRKQHEAAKSGEQGDAPDVATAIHGARILRTTVEGDHSRIVLSKGSDAGIHGAATGVVTVGSKNYRLEIVESSGRTSTARVSASPDVLQDYDRVTVNGGKQRNSIEGAKILRTTVKGDDSHVVLSKGEQDGVRAPTSGTITVGAKSHVVTIFDSTERSSTGRLDKVAPDAIKGPHTITIKGADAGK
jgi:hypothetical protein